MVMSNSDEINIENGFSFKLSSDEQKLLAVYTPCEDKIELTVEIVKERIESARFSHLFINEYILFEFIRCYKNATVEAFEIEIGERRDASCSIYFGEDKMKAYLSLIPNFGGNPITLANVQQALKDRGVIYGIIATDAIAAVLEKGRVEDFVIAQGLEPISGIDAKFLNFVPVINRTPHVDKQNLVDYRELGDILTVHKDDVLMQRIPAIKGTLGYNVAGEELDVGGIDTPFSADQRGICINPEDSNQLIATITGQPISVPNGVIVSPVLTLQNVDLTSGNIRFDGSIFITGDVEDGMLVHSIEDITIEGDVSNAKIECNGNLTIKGCVTGNSELTVDGDIKIEGGVMGTKTAGKNIGDSNPSMIRETKIVARGSINVSFAENFNIEAGGDIIITKHSINSQLLAGNKILLGGKNSKKSSIIGGITWAMLLVKAAIFGSDSGIKTRVNAGSNPYVQRRISQIGDILLQNADEQQNLHKILAYIAEHPDKGSPEILQRLHHTLSKMIIDAEIYQTELKELKANMAIIEDAKIVCERSVYTGTEIKINNAAWTAEEQRGKSVFTSLMRKISVASR
jgi:uncharacterized protein (DUF342 family)